MQSILDEAIEKNLLFLTDDDSLPQGTHPDVCIWDDGSDPIRQLDHEMKVRRGALKKMAQDPIAAIRPGR